MESPRDPLGKRGYRDVPGFAIHRARPAGADRGPDQPGGHAVARRHRHRGVQRGQHGFRSGGDGDRERLAAVGVSLLAGGTLGRASLDRSSPGGWTCAPAGGGATCTHGPLASCAPPARATGPNKLSGVALKQHGRGIHAVRAAGRVHARYDSVWMGYRGCCETHSDGTALI